MKNLNKLQINPDKILKRDELTTLSGGYDCGCLCYDWEFHLVGAIQSTALNCNADCTYFGPGYGYWSC